VAGTRLPRFARNDRKTRVIARRPPRAAAAISCRKTSGSPHLMDEHAPFAPPTLSARIPKVCVPSNTFTTVSHPAIRALPPRLRAIALKSAGSFWMESGHCPLCDLFNAESVAEFSPGQAAARRARPALGCPDRRNHAPTGQPKLRRGAPRRPWENARPSPSFVCPRAGKPARRKAAASYRTPRRCALYGPGATVMGGGLPGLCADAPLGQQRQNHITKGRPCRSQALLERHFSAGLPCSPA